MGDKLARPSEVTNLGEDGGEILECFDKNSALAFENPSGSELLMI